MKKYLKLLIGFPIGIFMLAITYILIYCIDGEATYISEISKLLEFEFMIEQFIFSGIVYTLVFLTLQIFIDIFSKCHLTWKGLGKFCGIYVLMIGFFLISSIMLDTLNGYSGTVFVGISVLLMIIISIGHVFYQVILNRKLNKALKEKQDQNKV